jgi:hypothetical protein
MTEETMQQFVEGIKIVQQRRAVFQEAHKAVNAAIQKRDEARRAYCNALDGLDTVTAPLGFNVALLPEQQQEQK